MGKYDYQGNPPDLRPSNVWKYLKRRPITLKPDPIPTDILLPNGKIATKKQLLFNPFLTLGLMNKKQWLFFLIAFLTWTWDAFDFFSVSLTASEIAETLHRPIKDITWGITLVLMFRPVGAVIFGIPSDIWGRKWPFIVNCVCFIILQALTGSVTTYAQLLAVRALLGVSIGGIFGNASSTALEDCPPECRGIISGMFQLGYPFGYLLCIVFNQIITYNDSHGWRALFWFGASPTVLLIIFRFFLPETDTFLAQKELKKLNPTTLSLKKTVASAAKNYWTTFIYLVCFLAGMNFMSHGSQDLYPVFLKTQLGFSKDAATVTNCVANFGAITGSMVVGHISQFSGRRIAIIGSCILGGALTYPWVYAKGTAINAAVFFFQFAVQGAWGTVPIYASELADPQFRTFIVGTAYQLGNLASSASSTIEAQIGSRFPILDENGNKIPEKYNYAKVMAIFLGAVFAYVMFVVFLGPERRHINFVTTNKNVIDPRDKSAMELDQIEKGDTDKFEDGTCEDVDEIKPEVNQVEKS